MKFTYWLLSFLLHAGVAGAAVWLSTPGAVNIDLGVPVYEVDLVKLEPAKKGRPKTVKKAPKPEPPKPEPPKPKPAKVAKAPEAVEVAKPKPAPAPKPEPGARKISPVKREAEKKPLPEPEKKARPEPRKAEPKPRKTKEQLLAEAMEQAKKDAAWLEHLEEQKAEEQERDEREALQKELAALRESVGSEPAGDEEEGAGGEAEEGAGSGTLLDVYKMIVRQEIQRNWRYPNIPMDKELSARVEIRLNPDGAIIDYSLIQTSGRPDFDASAVAAVKSTGKLPPPPDKELEVLRITFNLQDLLQ
jgi:colicin import membrane protein